MSRIAEKNKAIFRIKEIKHYLELDEKTLGMLYKRDMTAFNKNRIQKMEAKNTERRSELEELNKRIIDIDSGSLDASIQQTVKDNTATAKRKNKEKLLAKLDKQKIVKKPVVETKPQPKATKKPKRKQYNNNTNGKSNACIQEEKFAREYMYYCKKVDSISTHIQEKLKTMPNNKGYIWRDIYCFGEKPAEKNGIVTLFEKKHGDFYTHEITDTHHSVFKKNGKNRVLVDKYPVKKITEIYL